MIHQIAIDEGPPVCQAHGHGISSRVTVTNRAGVIAVLGKPTSSTEEGEMPDKYDGATYVVAYLFGRS